LWLLLLLLLDATVSGVSGAPASDIDATPTTTRRVLQESTAAIGRQPGTSNSNGRLRQQGSSYSSPCFPSIHHGCRYAGESTSTRSLQRLLQTPAMNMQLIRIVKPIPRIRVSPFTFA
jgi:hypothetical protein